MICLFSFKKCLCFCCRCVQNTDPEVLYLHAKACFDNDHKDTLGGYNIQTYLEMLQVCERSSSSRTRFYRLFILPLVVLSTVVVVFCFSSTTYVFFC